MFVELQGSVNGITAAFHALNFLVLTRFSFVVVIPASVQSLHIHSLVTVKFTMIIEKMQNLVVSGEAKSEKMYSA